MKRFFETTKFDDPWYYGLKPMMKLAWDYLLAKCDSAGIWAPNVHLAEVQIGGKVDWEVFQKVCGPRLAILPNGKWWVTKFVSFQYGKLSRDARVHQSVIKSLEINGIRVSDDGIAIPLACHSDDIPMSPIQEQGERHKGSAEGGGEKLKSRGSVEEIQSFCIELGLPASDGSSTFDKWQGNGWLNGKTPIKDWRATIRSWKGQGYMPSQKNGHSPGKIVRTSL